jgi:hypothetical protein
MSGSLTDIVLKAFSDSYVNAVEDRVNIVTCIEFMNALATAGFAVESAVLQLQTQLDNHDSEVADILSILKNNTDRLVALSDQVKQLPPFPTVPATTTVPETTAVPATDTIPASTTI